MLTEDQKTDTYRVWCLTWDEDDESGVDVIGCDVVVTEPKRNEIHVPFYNLDNGKEAAEYAAKHYHTYRDGWECNWPLTFRVRKPDGSLEDYEVERESIPQFRAAKVRK